MILFNLLVIAMLFIFVSFYLFVRYRYNCWKRLNVPYIEPKFPYGNLKGVGSAVHPLKRLQEFYTSSKQKSPFIGIFYFLKPVAVVTDLELAKNVLIKDFNNFNDRGVYYNERDDPISAHLVSLHGQKWRTLRNKMTSSFTSGKMKFMFTTILEVGERFQKRLNELSSDNNEIEIKDILSRYTTDMIGSCAFGIDCDTLSYKNEDFRIFGQKIFSNPRHSLAVRFFLISIRNIAQKFKIKMIPDDVSEFYTNVIKDMVSYRDENNIQRNDFLNILMELRNHVNDKGEQITFDEIRAQAFIFFSAGFETSSTLLNFTFYELAVNSDIQEKAREHVQSVLNSHKNVISYESVMDMKYLDCILNESLRKYPPITSVARLAEKNYKIPNSNHIIPKGCYTVIPIYAIHHDPEFYPNPEVFNPDNFSAENVSKRHPLTFIPFGEGPRICIGMRFAMLEAKVALIMILTKFRLSLSPRTDYPLKMKSTSLFLSPSSDVYVIVRPLNLS